MNSFHVFKCTNGDDEPFDEVCQFFKTKICLPATFLGGLNLMKGFSLHYKIHTLCFTQFTIHESLPDSKLFSSLLRLMRYRVVLKTPQNADSRSFACRARIVSGDLTARRLRRRRMEATERTTAFPQTTPSPGGPTTLETVDIVVLVVYFLLILAVGFWVSLSGLATRFPAKKRLDSM